ncbi:MAG: hypothetical protein C5B58_15675 [Acidobacteria bacterium]|nr:MAG: hypothetical protein C5B58_15675 [Acidobacteriota bacterium]
MKGDSALGLTVNACNIAWRERRVLDECSSAFSAFPRTLFRLSPNHRYKTPINERTRLRGSSALSRSERSAGMLARLHKLALGAHALFC